jgi:four helix bundle protein
MQDYKSLKVWQKAHQIVINIYKITKLFPKEELFCLVSQIRRAAISIPANIAEGAGRGSRIDFNRFLQISFRSISELEYELMLSNELGYINKDSYKKIEASIEEVKKMLSGLIKSIKKTIN